ncbi:MAG: hypothetical protein KatS3mg114_0991 [Planctomycetaceae bacterium]|nr:MAG: hypothetical protein KatS3mg114_0991 [Planctomycetaceae bacterium]
MGRGRSSWIIGCLLLSGTVAAFELRPNEHIGVIGNGLAERWQHDGWLETLIHARFPQHRLVFRHLGYSGDEVDGWQNPHHRLRSMSFGSQDEWLAGKSPVPQPNKLGPRDAGQFRDNRFELTDTRVDVIFACFGYNESHAGEAGLPAFRDNLRAFLQHTLSQKYNGTTPPRIVLFSPTALEWLDDPHLLSREALTAANQRLKLYTQAMQEVCQQMHVTCVDVFTPTHQWWGEGRPDPPAATAVALWSEELPAAHTINGLHLNTRGQRRLAEFIVNHLFPQQTCQLDEQQLQRLRAAVNEKNFYWFHRYRVTDGYSTYGDRAFLRFSEGPGGYGEGLSNYTVLQRELEVLDLLTANRDRVVWAAAQGQAEIPQDDNLPPFIPVISNKPGPLEGGKHVFLDPEAAIQQMTIGQGLQVELVASEQQFPELVNPVQMAFDTRGRLWVAAWPTYPHWRPTEPMNDKLLILEDTNGDGRADLCKTFADDLHNPTGFEFWHDGVLVAQGPDLLFLRDVDGDDRYDIRQRIVHGLDTADTHHTANSFIFDPGGALYFQEGTFHHSQVETPWGPPRRVANGAVFRFEPRAQKFDIYVTFGFANPHGHAFDSWGQDFVYDGTGAQPYHGTLFSGHLEYPHKHQRPPQVYQQRTRPCPGVEILSSSHFPEEYRNNLLVANVIGFQGILRYRLQNEGSSFTATELEPLVSSTDPNFRPSDLETGPDGALYFVDWQNPIIGHMQHNLRDPSRDKTHGRVYRIVHQQRLLLTPVAIAGRPLSELLDLLKHPDLRVRYRVRLELSARPTSEVLTAVTDWLNRLRDADPDYEHHVLEALWLHQHHDVVNLSLLQRVLDSPRFEARAAAVRVLVAWRDRVPQALHLLRHLAQDEHPRVRLEVVRAASFFTQPEAYEIVLIAAERPLDPYLEYLIGETKRALEPVLERALAQGIRPEFTTEAGARYFLGKMPTDRLLQEPRNRAVYLEMLYRPGLREEVRREAVTGLAQLDRQSELTVLIQALDWLDKKSSHVDVGVIFDLIRLLITRPVAELSQVRAELEKLALQAHQPIFRQIGWVTLMTIDRRVEPAWELAIQTPERLEDFILALPLVSDPSIQATLYERMVPLLEELPPPLKDQTRKGPQGRYVRIEIPGRGTLTLAEVEVYSQGENVALRGRATQKNTAHGGEARRAIDGNRSGAYGEGSQTHTEENTGNPWWEVDLGATLPIERIVVYNRTDGNLGERLNQWTLRVLDEKRREVFRLERLPVPRPVASFDLIPAGSHANIRRAAMQVLAQVRGQEARSFQLLAHYVQHDADPSPALSALMKIPPAYWSADQAPPLLEVLLRRLQQTPASGRTTPEALAAQEFAWNLAGLLPADRAREIRAQLKQLGVRVLRLGTVFERMAYDKEVLVAEAGKPVEILFENSDLMPHNLVIVRPGALESVGMMAEAQAQQPGFAERHYVPATDQVLLSSRLLQPRESQRLSFTVPQQPGVYPYVCTYPGHWRRMYGALYVVPDLEAYEAEPDAYLARLGINATDPLLKDRRPRTEWALADLLPLAEHLQGRSHSRGKQMFAVANCVACHRLENVGNSLGPDLAKLNPKPTVTEIIESIVEPSRKINEKYQTQVFQLFDGRVISGLVVEETPDVIRVIENPLVSLKPIEIRRQEVEERARSPISQMPKGLLDKLTRDEILDLLAYVVAGGNSQHAIYRQTDHHHHH